MRLITLDMLINDVATAIELPTPQVRPVLTAAFAAINQHVDAGDRVVLHVQPMRRDEIGATESVGRPRATGSRRHGAADHGSKSVVH